MISRDDVRTSNHIPQLLMAAFQNDNCIVIRNKGLKPIKKRIEIVLAVLIITVGVRIVVVISDAGNTAKRTKAKDSIAILVLFFPQLNAIFRSGDMGHKLTKLLFVFDAEVIRSY